MPYTLNPPDKKFIAPSFWLLLTPLRAILRSITFLKARGNRPLQMEFEDQLNALIYFHLEEHTSGRHLLQVLEEDDFARLEVAPEAGIKKSSFFEAINSRGTFTDDGSIPSAPGQCYKNTSHGICPSWRPYCH